MNQSRLWTYLDEVEFPWQLDRASLVERYGVKQHAAYNWEVIEIETQPPVVRGLLWPISAQAFPQFSLSVPATEFSGVTYFGEDARRNLNETVDQLSRHFGDGQPTGASNSLGHKWELGPACVEVHVWPSDMQRWAMNNPSHTREPRLKAGCSISIKTGLQIQANEVEGKLIKSFNPIARISPGQPQGLNSQRTVPQSELEYVRQFEFAFSSSRGWIGSSGDGSTVIFFNQWLYLVPLNEVVEFRVWRTLPGKGPGGARFCVECRGNSPWRQTKSLMIAEGPRADDLSDLASSVALALDKPLVLMPYDYDV
jgi:hypothetical protein